MKVSLKRVESRGISTLKNLGTFGSNLEVGDKIQFSNKNLLKDTRVQVYIFEEAHAGEPPLAQTCSTEVSKVIRQALKTGHTRKEVLASLLKLSQLESESGTFLSPTGIPAELFTLSDLIEEKAIDYLELVKAVI
jgi:hypothetical protein